MEAESIAISRGPGWLHGIRGAVVGWLLLLGALLWLARLVDLVPDQTPGRLAYAAAALLPVGFAFLVRRSLNQMEQDYYGPVTFFAEVRPPSVLRIDGTIDENVMGANHNPDVALGREDMLRRGFEQVGVYQTRGAVYLTTFSVFLSPDRLTVGTLSQGTGASLTSFFGNNSLETSSESGLDYRIGGVALFEVSDLAQLFERHQQAIAIAREARRPPTALDRTTALHRVAAQQERVVDLIASKKMQQAYRRAIFRPRINTLPRLKGAIDRWSVAAA